MLVCKAKQVLKGTKNICITKSKKVLKGKTKKVKKEFGMLLFGRIVVYKVNAISHVSTVEYVHGAEIMAIERSF